jgi:hypothetical protein
MVEKRSVGKHLGRHRHKLDMILKRLDGVDSCGSG